MAPAMSRVVKKHTTMENKGGRPPHFTTPEQLQKAISHYFEHGIPKKTYIIDKKAVKIEVPTITGLCYHIGFESRQSFYAYEKKEGFSYTIKRARLFIEKHYEELLQVGNTTGAIFALKNFDWTDKQQHEHDVSPLITHTLIDALTESPDISEEELELAIKLGMIKTKKNNCM